MGDKLGVSYGHVAQSVEREAVTILQLPQGHRFDPYRVRFFRFNINLFEKIILNIYKSNSFKDNGRDLTIKYDL